MCIEIAGGCELMSINERPLVRDNRPLVPDEGSGARLGRELAELRALLVHARTQAREVPSARYHIEVAIRRVDDLADDPGLASDQVRGLP